MTSSSICNKPYHKSESLLFQASLVSPPRADVLSSLTKARDGGVGLSSSINGTATFRGGGGGSQSYGAGNNFPVGGNGGGADGNFSSSVNGNHATANTGGGGAGAGSEGSGPTSGNGGSGIVIIRYAL